ncbi:hypothetical protein LINPERHAP1_LOCUS48, partial [Linum perenne]
RQGLFGIWRTRLGGAGAQSSGRFWVKAPIRYPRSSLPLPLTFGLGSSFGPGLSSARQARLLRVRLWRKRSRVGGTYG